MNPTMVPISVHRLEASFARNDRCLDWPGWGRQTSQTAQLTTIFQKQNLKCTAIYLGSGEGGWRLRRAAKRQFRKWRGKVAESGSGAKGPTPKEYGTNHSVWTGMSGLAAALERYVSLRRAIRLARSGSLVICDRWPQNIQPGFFDGMPD